MNRTGKGSRRKRTIIAVLAASAVFAAPLLALTVDCSAQPLPEGMMAKQEQARSLEREIAGLEAQMAKIQSDWVTISRKLSEIQKQIVSCYLEIDAARAEVEDARRNLNTRIRDLYVGGRADDLARLFDSRDLSDFIVKYDYMIDATVREARAFEELREKRRRIERRQEELIRYKREAARLERAGDTSATEAELAGKKQQLAGVTGEIIAMELPITQAPAPTSFNPVKIYAMPDENGFVRTGQVFSGYSSWYGGEFHGRPTASGEVYDQYGFTCAHRTLPFGTWLRVTFRGRTVVVKVNDRGPFVSGRVLDLSRGAAEAVGLTGVQWVDCELVIPRGS